MFRSQTMSLNKVMFANDSMWDTMNLLASTNRIMMHYHENPNVANNKNSLVIYGDNTSKRCEEMLIQIQEVKTKMAEFRWPLTKIDKPIHEYIFAVDQYCKHEQIHGQKLFDNEEKQMVKKLEILQEFLQNYEGILKQRVELFEQGFALGLMDEMIPFNLIDDTGINTSMSLNRTPSDNSNIERSDRQQKKFHTILGLLPTKNILKFQKILFRISRGNIILKTKNLPFIEDEFLENIQKEQKDLIFMILPKTEKEVIIDQIQTILQSMEFKEMEIMYSRLKNEMNLNNKMNLEENQNILLKTQSEINEIFGQFSQEGILQGVSYINCFEILIQREICFAKNLLFIQEKDGFNQLLFWTTRDYKEELNLKIKNLNQDDNNFIPPKIEEVRTTTLTPPTYFRTNKFTHTFQEIVNTYGIPRYKECNPGLFTIVSFPFLFGLMFGDIGHGLCVTIFSFFLLLFQKDQRSLLYSVKYMLFLMGLFSLYCGLIYNEFFSVPLVFQSSCYEKQEHKFVRKTEDCVYSIGMDHIWFESENETAFVNSFKMKFAIIVGVIQMLFGIFLKGLNAIYFRQFLDLFFEALPQIIFLTVTFGYMSFLIIMKWLTNFDGIDKPVSIITIFIDFFSVEDPLIGTKEFQQTLQQVFVIVCFLCILLMLIPKPLIILLRKKDVIAHEQKEEVDVQQSLIENNNQSGNHHDEDASEVIVHQMIETIEFVLGSISNTASYLRLWALSLAHGQLSKVFLELIFKWAITDAKSILGSFITIVLGFVFFMGVTLAVILIMDFMECFLHGLRLHWVEFQNKFFKGDGKLFKVFDYGINSH